MSEDTPLLSDNVSDIVTVENTTLVDNSTLAWAHEWLGYLALGMFSMVLFIPTLGIIGLMLWEYFSDEAERKAERQKEIEKVIKERYLGIKEEKNEEEDSDEDLDGLDGFDGEDFDDNDDNDDDINLDEEAETLLHKRKPKFTKPEDFDTIYYLDDIQTGIKLVKHITVPKLDDNIRYSCVTKFDCPYVEKEYRIKCEQLEDITWFIPRNYTEYELMYVNGYDDNNIDDTGAKRIVYNTIERFYLKDKRYYIIKSDLLIINFGIIHNGVYYCSHDRYKSRESFALKTIGHMVDGKCRYDDHCQSNICHNKKCKCNKGQVYISDSDQCVNSIKFDDQCQYDAQCSQILGKGRAKCVDSRCKCRESYTMANITMNRKMCYKIADLNQQCKSSAQCSAGNENAFCGMSGCQCKSGYKLDVKSNECIARRQCDSSALGFNDKYERGDCASGEFCRQSVCLCLPNYRLSTDDDKCHAPNISDEKWYNKYGYYIIAAMAVLLILIIALIVIQLRRYRRIRGLQNQQSHDSRDVLNES